MMNSTASRVCPACRFGTDCIYEAGSLRRILQCEQFELAFPAPPSASLAELNPAVETTNGARSLVGLCSNCDLRDDCLYPKPDGGVWRCEEYR
jgi:hypothetical protein